MGTADQPRHRSCSFDFRGNHLRAPGGAIKLQRNIEGRPRGCQINLSWLLPYGNTRTLNGVCSGQEPVHLGSCCGAGNEVMGFTRLPAVGRMMDTVPALALTT